MAQVGLLGCARIIVEKMANVRDNERVLILTDHNYPSKELTNLMFEDALACGAEAARLITTPPKETFSNASIRVNATLVSSDIPHIAKIAADAADVVFICLSSYTPRQVRNDLVGKGKRVMGMHLLSDELALRTVPIDLDLLQKRVAKLTKLFPATEEARITSPEGTDITFSLRNRKFTMLYDGICNRGEYESVPAGVIGALPVPGTANGVIVIDGSLAGYGLVRAPIRITVKDGILTKIEGGAEAEWVEKSIKRALASGDRNANRFVEFDMGLNPNARVSFYGGKLREDELHLGGVNIGWGRDAHLGGTFEGVFHGDGIVMDVTISLDDVTVIKNGMPTQELS